MQWMKVPDGEQPANGKIIARGGDYNLWQAQNSFDTGYTVISEGECMVEGLKIDPGTLLPTEVDDLVTRLLNDYGITLSSKTIDYDGKTLDMVTFLKDHTGSWPAGHPKREEHFEI